MPTDTTTNRVNDDRIVWCTKYEGISVDETVKGEWRQVVVYENNPGDFRVLRSIFTGFERARHLAYLDGIDTLDDAMQAAESWLLEEPTQ